MTTTEPTTVAFIVDPAVLLEARQVTDRLRDEITDHLSGLRDIIDQCRREELVIDRAIAQAQEQTAGWQQSVGDGTEDLSDEISRIIRVLSGWNELYTALYDLSNAVHPEELGAWPEEVMRGELNYPVGTLVELDARDGTKAQMEIVIAPGPKAEQPGLYTVRSVADPSQRFLASHDEIKIGVER